MIYYLYLASRLGGNRGSGMKNTFLLSYCPKPQAKRHFKSEFALPQTLSRLFHLVQFVKCWLIFLEFGLYQMFTEEN